MMDAPMKNEELLRDVLKVVGSAVMGRAQVAGGLGRVG
jgi:hypothetical protein